MKKTIQAKDGMAIDVTSPSGKSFLDGLNENLKSNHKVPDAERKAIMKKIRELKGIPVWNRL